MRNEGLYNVPLTLEVVGKLFGLTRERIRQLEVRAYAEITDYSHPFAVGLSRQRADGPHEQDDDERMEELSLDELEKAFRVAQLSHSDDAVQHCLELSRKLPLSLVLPKRTANSLGEWGMRQIRDVLLLSENELLTVPNIGKKQLRHMYAMVRRLGLRCAADTIPDVPEQAAGETAESSPTEDAPPPPPVKIPAAEVAHQFARHLTVKDGGKNHLVFTAAFPEAEQTLQALFDNMNTGKKLPKNLSRTLVWYGDLLRQGENVMQFKNDDDEEI